MPALRNKLPQPSSEVIRLVHKYSSAMGVPFDLVMTIMRIESAFKASAVNHAASAEKYGGAWGIGQILYTTAQDMTKRFPKTASKFWGNWDGTKQGLLDLETNVAMTCFYLWQSWERYKGTSDQWKNAGLSHHQGRGNVDKFLAANNGVINPAKLPPFGLDYWQKLSSHRWSEASV